MSPTVHYKNISENFHSLTKAMKKRIEFNYQALKIV